MTARRSLMRQVSLGLTESWQRKKTVSTFRVNGLTPGIRLKSDRLPKAILLATQKVKGRAVNILARFILVILSMARLNTAAKLAAGSIRKLFKKYMLN